MSGSGKGGNNRRNRPRFSGKKDDSRLQKQDMARPKEGQARNFKKAGENLIADGKFEKNRPALQERPFWTAPKLPTEPIPVPECPWCGKPIKDISTAISDKNSGFPVHFDCIIARLTETEPMESNDVISYIGGGRFGIIHYNNPQDVQDFKIKKIFEWENKDNRCEWRRNISDHFSAT